MPGGWRRRSARHRRRCPFSVASWPTSISRRQGWFLSFHCFTKNIKVTFSNGAELGDIRAVDGVHKFSVRTKSETSPG